VTKPPFGVDRCGIESVSYVLVLREWTVLGDGEWLQFAIRYFSDVLLFMVMATKIQRRVPLPPRSGRNVPNTTQVEVLVVRVDKHA
jgi:hypothetical protein